MSIKIPSKEDVKNFTKKHKDELCWVGASILVVGLSVAGFKYLPKKARKQRINPSAPTAIPFQDLWSNLSGEKLTPSKLGDRVMMSPQQINKRLVSQGLQIRLPCGEYVMTDLGKKFGESTLKTRSHGHTFSNIEWDSRVLEIIFTPGEMQNIADRKSHIADILSK